MSARLAGRTAFVPVRGSGDANVLDADALARLEVGLLAAERDGADAAVLHGPPGRFAAGADLRALADLDGPAAHAFARAGSRLFRRMRGADLWLIAAVDGHCIGGGLDVALACDAIVATGSAFFRHPGARFGFPTAYGGNRMLPARLGPAIAATLLLEGRALTATEAHRAGLVAAVVEPEALLDAAGALAARWSLAAKPAVRGALRQVSRVGVGVSCGAASALELAALGCVAASR
jgi:enoyl-CoA hydratase/carnithine racemase